MSEDKKSPSYDEIWAMLDEPCDCKDCLNYEWVDDEVGYQCCYAFCPPCETKHS